MEILDTLIEVDIGENTDNFLKIKETLSRIGVASRKEKKLYQSCHILHKRGKYYIVHFKELFLLDGKSADYSDNDVMRRNTIVNLLQEWQLLTVVDKNKFQQMQKAPISQVKIISHKEKNEWELVTKYNIGKYKRQNENIE
jgi:hypothetical protein